MNSRSDKYMFVKHNLKYFNFKKFNNNKKILIEFSHWSSLHIASTYLLAILQKKFKANIIAYFASLNLTRPIKMSLKDRIKWILGNLFSVRFFGIFKSMGTTKFLWPNPNLINQSKINKIYNQKIRLIKNKRDIENMKIENIWVGDIIYDSYLKYFNVGTIDIDSLQFKNYLKDTIGLFLYWTNYINKNNIKAIIVSHSVYLLSMPARIGIKKNIKVYVCHGEYLYSLSKSNLFIRANFFKAKKILKKIDKKIIKAGIEKAKYRIESRLKGEPGIDLWWAKKSSFGPIKSKRVLNKNNKFKFLIANHSFVDSPHAYGNNLFPDFFEWLEFLGKISMKTNHEWYLKTHPYKHKRESNITLDIIHKIIKKYPKIKLLSSTVSHNQLVSEGINCVLTVLGSVGFEYAYMNVPVINASRRNPHINFNFNIHAESISHYEKLLLNPKNIKLKINRQEILKYYFLMHIYYTRNWLFDDYEMMQKKVKDQYDSEVYKYWIRKEFSVHKHQEILNCLNKFVNSSDYRLGYKHINRNILHDIKQ